MKRDDGLPRDSSLDHQLCMHVRKPSAGWIARIVIAHVSGDHYFTRLRRRRQAGHIDFDGVHAVSTVHRDSCSASCFIQSQLKQCSRERAPHRSVVQLSNVGRELRVEKRTFRPGTSQCSGDYSACPWACVKTICKDVISVIPDRAHSARWRSGRVDTVATRLPAREQHKRNRNARSHDVGG